MPESNYSGDAGPLGIYSDAAKRLADSYTMHSLISANHGRWLAVRISDGVVFDARTHETVFDSHGDGTRTLGQFASLYFMTRILPGGMNPKSAATLINYNRELYSKGARMPTPGVSPTMPGRRWELM